MEVLPSPKFNKKEYNKAYLEANKENIIKCLVKEIWNAITLMKSSAQN